MADNKDQLLAFTAQIVSAYVGKHDVALQDVPNVVRVVHDALATVGENLRPAVPIAKSVMPDYIVCLEDGKKLKMLKRYLKAAYNMTPEEYREKWGLGADYPMVAPNYAQKRSSLARKSGLGLKEKSAKD